MGKSAKPWLNYKSHQDINDYKQAKLQRTERTYRTALLYLVFIGFAGAHLFYLYDERRAWRVFGCYFALMIITALLKPFFGMIQFIALVCYAFGVIFATYPTLKADVERINQEIKND